jgi:hypothetical protein
MECECSGIKKHYFGGSKCIGKIKDTNMRRLLPDYSRTIKTNHPLIKNIVKVGLINIKITEKF